MGQPCPEKRSHHGREFRPQGQQPRLVGLSSPSGDEAMEEQRVREHLHFQDHHRQVWMVVRWGQHPIGPVFTGLLLRASLTARAPVR